MTVDDFLHKHSFVSDYDITIKQTTTSYEALSVVVNVLSESIFQQQLAQ